MSEMNDLMNESQPESPLPPPQPVPPQAPAPHAFPVKPMLIFGVGMIFLGVLAALDNLGIADMHIVIKLFVPLVLISMGVVKIRQDGGTGGYALVIAGAFALLISFGRHAEEFIGPMVLVAVGIFVIVKSLNKHRGKSPDQRYSEDMVSGSAIFSGYKRRVVSQAFRGGDLTSIFGGFEVDLRQASIKESPARIDIFVLFGGGELRVPEDWRVEIQASAVFGGIEDKTHCQGEAIREDQPRLIVTGMALFGGMEVKH